MPKKKMDSLQGVRAIAFLGIFGSHTGLECFMPTGVWGVSVFLVLSGFLMTWSYLGKGRIESCSIVDNARFAIGKIKKLYALHIVMLLAAMPLMLHAFLGAPSVPAFFSCVAKTVASIFLLQTLVPFSDFYFCLSGVAWYLSVCVFLYFAFPWLLRIAERFRTGRDAVIALAVTYAIQLLTGWLSVQLDVPKSLSNGFTKWFVYICPFSRLGDFFIGMCVGWIFLKEPPRWSELTHTALEALSLALIVLQMVLYLNIMPAREDVITVPSLWWLIVWFTPSSCLFIYIFAFGRGAVSRFLCRPHIVWLGSISSITFLIHWVTIVYVRACVTAMMPSASLNCIFLISAVIALAATLVLSVAWQRLEAFLK